MTKELEEKIGISFMRYSILIFLRDKGDSLQTEIAAYLGIDPVAVTRHLWILEEEGYIIRTRNHENRRQVIVSLTDFANKKLLECKKNEGQVPVSFTVEEIHAFNEIFKKWRIDCSDYEGRILWVSSMTEAEV